MVLAIRSCQSLQRTWFLGTALLSIYYCCCSDISIVRARFVCVCV